MSHLVHIGGGGFEDILEHRTKIKLNRPNGGPDSVRQGVRSPRDKHAKRALVLGGGGIAGAAFEVGALLALNDVLSGFKATDFDIYVGTSAGSFLCACLVNGITPEDFARSQIGREPPNLPSINPGEILKPVHGRLSRGVAAWAGGIRSTARQVARNPRHLSLVDVFFSLASDLSSSLYTTEGLQQYLQMIFSMSGRTNRFDKLDKELYVVGTDLDTAERTVFGEEEMPAASISQAVAASAAIPVIYEPVKIKGREYIDGGLRSPTNLDIALAHGAGFVVMVNPLVPYLHDPRYLLRAFDSDVRHVSDGGLGRLAAQVFRIMAHTQVEKELELMRLKYPETEILVVEPRRDDEHLFVFNLMDYSVRDQIAKDAFEHVAVELVTHFPEIQKLFNRCGIEVSKKGLVEQLKRVLSGGTAAALVDQQMKTEETA
jgi:predicted acylesterase/phospholipase RssA